MEKIERLRSAFDEAGIDGILLTNEHSRRYMANFTGTAGVVLISKDRAQFITDFRYVEQASKQAVGYEVVQHAGLIIDEVAKQVKELGIQNLVLSKILLHIVLIQCIRKRLMLNLSRLLDL